ncbi:MAG: hypothetical protein B1H11_07670 [Desulfobacteraceae bacterium 4484_190.1]|nr:MAG: hypothetical protein B1H11_07670 [Desulfobacteraceae bacterium 4484_190.1]
MDFAKNIDVRLPSGVYNVNYRSDTALFRTGAHKVLLACFLASMFLLPLLGLGSHWLNFAISIFIAIIAVQGLNLLTGYCGQISLAHAAFVGVGAYTSAILCSRLGFPFWISTFVAGGMSGLVGLVFGIPALRLKGFYLAMSTLAAQFILIWLFIHLRSITGGTDSLAVVAPSIGSFEFSSPRSLYYLCLSVVIIMTGLAKNIVRTKAGRAFVAVRDNDLGAAVMGVNLFAFKLLAFFTSAFFAGVAGTLYAVWVGHIHPENFMLMESIWFLGMLVIGGMGAVMGPIFGVVFLKSLEEIVQIYTPVIAEAFPYLGGGQGSLSFASMSQMLFGGIIGLFLILEPRGIVHQWEILKTSFRMWPFSH